MAALKGVKTLDMVDGEITKVSYEGAEYERVEGDAKDGDLVLNGRIHPDLTADGFYEVIREEETGWVSVKDDIGDYHSRVLGITKTAVFRKKHVRLKVGDYAKVVGTTHYSDIVGGAIVKITDLADESGDLRFELVGDGDYDYAKPSSLEKVSAEEAKWAKIGRKVDEYKVGDIVAYDDDPRWFGNEGFGEITADSTYGCGPEIKAIGRSGYYEYRYVRKSSLTLITPVEARFDRG
ncbi:hypothetical protein ACN6A9_01600 [Bacillus safensis]